jgi:protein-export SecD/SecF family membrane protein
VSGTVSQELTKKAFLSILYASVLIILYLAVRFSIGGFVEGLKFGTCAVIAMIHDVGVVWGAFAILGYALNWQVDSLFVTAILTVIGFSVHDTIVIFDRIRENLRNRQRGETFGDVTDRSIEQTLARSINTSLTVILTLIPLLIFGGSATRLFVTALLLGVISGTYSSIFNASPLVVLWKRLSGGDKPLGTTAPAAAPAARPAQRPAVRPSTPAPAVAASPVSRPSSAPATPQDGSSPATAEERGVAKAPKRRKQRRR